MPHYPTQQPWQGSLTPLAFSPLLARVQTRAISKQNQSLLLENSNATKAIAISMEIFSIF